MLQNEKKKLKIHKNKENRRGSQGSTPTSKLSSTMFMTNITSSMLTVGTWEAAHASDSYFSKRQSNQTCPNMSQHISSSPNMFYICGVRTKETNRTYQLVATDFNTFQPVRTSSKTLKQKKSNQTCPKSSQQVSACPYMI